MLMEAEMDDTTGACPWRIVFMGTPEFAVPGLERLLRGPDTVVGVFTQPDRPTGRGMKLQPSPVKAVAVQHGVPVWQPVRLRGEESVAVLRDLQPDLVVVIAYGQILSREILGLPRYGCINVHASLLPRWRGAAPIQRAIMSGDTETGITIMQMEEGLDSGPALARRACAIPERMTGGALHDLLSVMGGDLLLETVAALKQGTVCPEVQRADQVTYAYKLTAADERIDWNRDSTALVRQIRALAPWPGARSRCGDQDLKILDAVVLSPSSDTGGEPFPAGYILPTQGVDVVCGEGSTLRLMTVQPAGKRPMAALDWWRGRRGEGGLLT
jgi:methionyl-tRNA formyltransferase